MISTSSLLLTDEEEDDEEVYKMASVMAQCGGLECMLNRLSGIKDFKQGRHLLTVRPRAPNFLSAHLPASYIDHLCWQNLIFCLSIAGFAEVI